MRMTWESLQLIILLGLMGMCPSLCAATSFSGVLPGGALLDKTVTSMRDLHFTHIVRQEKDFSCGAAALATILKYAFGLNVSEDAVTKGMMRVSNPEIVKQRGFSLLDIKHYVDSIGLQGHGYRVELEQLGKLRRPAIVMLDIKGYKHFVVVSKVTPETVYLADPALGNRTMRLLDFGQSWNRLLFIITGRGYDPQSVLLSPAAPLSAHKQINAFRPLPDAQLLDFGFVPMELF